MCLKKITNQEKPILMDRDPLELLGQGVKNTEKKTSKKEEKDKKKFQKDKGDLL